MLLFATEAKTECALSHGQLFTEPFLITPGSRWEVRGVLVGVWGGEEGGSGSNRWSQMALWSAASAVHKWRSKTRGSNRRLTSVLS